MSSPPLRSRLRLIPIVLGQAFGLLCGIVGIRLNSHLVPPALLGVYGVFLTFAPIGTWLVHAGLVKLVARNWAASDRRADLWRQVALTWARRLPWLALAAAAAAFAMRGLPETRPLPLILALFFSASLLALAALAQTALQAERTHWRDCAVSATGSLTRTFAPPLLFAATTGTVNALWLGFCLHGCVTAAAGLWALHPYWRASKNGPDQNSRPAFPPVYEGPLFIALAFVGWALPGLNRWVVAGFFGEVQAGYFTLASGALVLPATLGAVLMQYFQPGLFTLGDGPAALRPTLAHRVDLIALVHALGSLAALGVLVWVGPYLIGNLISPRYRDALGWLLPVGCFGTATITGAFYHTLLLAGRQERACGPVDLTHAALLAGGSLIAAAAGGQLWFERWLLVTPLVPWLVTRPMARHYVLRPGADPAPATAR
jgi:hypothetical protein